MNSDMKEAFSRIKPVCDVVMVCPSQESIKAYIAKIGEMKKEVVQELQQYILFPFITHLKSKEIGSKYELQCRMVDAMRVVLEKVSVNNYEMYLKIETGLLSLVFDKSKTGMVAEVPEELKLSIMRSLTVLMLNVNQQLRQKLLSTSVPLLAQAVFLAVHIAKLEKLRALRLAAIECVMAHTAIHPRLTDSIYHLPSDLEELAVDMLSSILPGVLAALQDVATSTENPGHAVVAAALDATHRILCLTMSDKHLSREQEVTANDFAQILKEKAVIKDREVNSKVIIAFLAKYKGNINPKDLQKRSPEWYRMAGEKLTLVTKSLVALRTHEHHAVRKGLAVLCSRLLTECNTAMQPSIPLALDVLISLSKDDYAEVAQYCTSAVNAHLSKDTTRHRAMDGLSENFLATLTSLPRILNNIDSSRKLSAINLLHGYVQILCDDARPQRLTAVLSVHNNMQCACNALLEAAEVTPLTSLAQHAVRDVSAPPPSSSPWLQFRHLEPQCSRQLRDLCSLLGSAESAELLADELLEHLQRRSCSAACLATWMAAAPESSPNLVQRVLDAYLEEDLWYLPLEVGGEAALTEGQTLDVTVYNPRAWAKDSVPDLYEGAVETRYTDISYSVPRSPQDPPGPTLAEAQRNLLLSCLLTEGVGVMARRLAEDFQPYLLKTLCLILERVGSKYEMLHLAGLKALNEVAVACGHVSVAELIRSNADYFTSQVTRRLKKAWNTESALQILTVVMEYSDSSIQDCLYGIVQDVLVQSCDKYYERNLRAYLQVFLTFIHCIRKWFPLEDTQTHKESSRSNVDILEDALEFANNQEESERLLDTEELEKETGKSVEEMYREDLEKKEEDALDYDDTVTQEKQPLPHHVIVTITILKRCLNFIPSPRRDESLLALQLLALGLPILRRYEDELLPLVHQTWGPFVGRFGGEPVVVRRALELLVVMADLAKDFIRTRALKEILPQIYINLHKSSSNSHLKDVGSAYRSSQAYQLQIAELTALPTLIVDLGLEDAKLSEAMACVNVYLSKKQPKPLQKLSVEFFKTMLEYDYGATWSHLRKLCGNELVLQPPPMEYITLEPLVGTPYEPSDKDYVNNIKLIFNHEL